MIFFNQDVKDDMNRALERNDRKSRVQLAHVINSGSAESCGCFFFKPIILDAGTEERKFIQKVQRTRKHGPLSPLIG